MLFRIITVLDQGLKGTRISGGITLVKRSKIDPQIKSNQSGYQDQAIKIMYIPQKYSALFVFLFNINFIQIIHFSIVYIDFSVPHYLFLAIALALTDRVQILYDST